MDLEEIRSALHGALPIRIPRFDPNESPRTKVAALEEYILDTAHYRGELEEALHWIWEVQKLLREQYNEIEGWEPLVPFKRRGDATKEMMHTAKRQVAPETVAALEDANHLAEALGRQIRRLELDYEAASRAYTLMSGA